MQTPDPTRQPTSPLSADHDIVRQYYTGVLQSLHALSETCYRIGRLDEAVIVLRNSLPYLEAPDVAPTDVIQTLLQLGRMQIARYAFHLRDDEQLRPTLLRAKTLADSLGDARSIAAALQLLGEAGYYRLLWDNSSNFELSDIQTYFQQARELRERLNDLRGLSETWRFNGLLAERQRLSDLALKCYQQSLHYAQQARSPLDEAEALRHLGGFALARYDYDTAESYLSLSLNLRQSQGYRIQLPAVQLTVGYVYEARGELERAFALYTVAYKLSNEMNLLRSEVFSLLSMGDIRKLQGDIIQALGYYEQAYNLAENREFQSGLLAANARLAELSHTTGTDQ